jgi:serine phosphatase RsbU (regulator of sigma subunit)
VVIAALRSRQEGRLVQVSTVAEAAQLAVLPPLPGSVGGVEVAALYRAATVGALVGGDLYDVRSGPYGVRALVADVQGHGLAAVGTVTGLLGAFREAALDLPDLRAVADRLDRRISLDARGGELFATALLLEFPASPATGPPGEADPTGGAAPADTADRAGEAAPGTVRLVCRGHPPPLLLRDGRVSELPCDPGPPLGLRLPGPPPPGPSDTPLLPGDLILAHTDGVTEARSADGRFYPLADRLTAWLADGTRPTPRGLVDTVWADLDAFAGAVADDVALLALAPGAGPGGTAVPPP